MNSLSNLPAPSQAFSNNNTNSTGAADAIHIHEDDGEWSSDKVVNKINTLLLRFPSSALGNGPAREQFVMV